MPYAVDWVTRIISVPVASMTLVSGTEYQLEADDFWREIRRLEWEISEGLWAPNILDHNNTRTIAGTTYVPENQIVNGYTIVFDPTATKVFLKGDNNNIIDVLVINGVSVIPSNTAGNSVVEVSTGGISDSQMNQLIGHIWGAS